MAPASRMTTTLAIATFAPYLIQRSFCDSPSGLAGVDLVSSLVSGMGGYFQRRLSSTLVVRNKNTAVVVTKKTKLPMSITPLEKSVYRRKTVCSARVRQNGGRLAAPLTHHGRMVIANRIAIVITA